MRFCIKIQTRTWGGKEGTADVYILLQADLHLMEHVLGLFSNQCSSLLGFVHEMVTFPEQQPALCIFW